MIRYSDPIIFHILAWCDGMKHTMNICDCITEAFYILMLRGDLFHESKISPVVGPCLLTAGTSEATSFKHRCTPGGLVPWSSVDTHFDLSSVNDFRPPCYEARPVVFSSAEDKMYPVFDGSQTINSRFDFLPGPDDYNSLCMRLIQAVLNRLEPAQNASARHADQN